MYIQTQTRRSDGWIADRGHLARCMIRKVIAALDSVERLEWRHEIWCIEFTFISYRHTWRCRCNVVKCQVLTVLCS